MTRFLQSTRYFILIPILGLAVAAIFFFVFGGIGLLSLLLELASEGLGGHAASDSGLVVFEVVEYVHTFLIGTVLYITAMGLFQLFIKQIDFPDWLKVDNTEELETNLIGVTVVVLAVNFMGAMFTGGGTENLLNYGLAIAFPIAGLGVFVALRAWSSKLNREGEAHKIATGDSASQENEWPAGDAEDS